MWRLIHDYATLRSAKPSSHKDFIFNNQILTNQLTRKKVFGIYVVSNSPTETVSKQIQSQLKNKGVIKMIGMPSDVTLILNINLTFFIFVVLFTLLLAGVVFLH